MIPSEGPNIIHQHSLAAASAAGRGPWESFGAAMERIAARILGCWHLNMSRPFTQGHLTYCVCLKCGMCRDFDLKSRQMTGPPYFRA